MYKNVLRSALPVALMVKDSPSSKGLLASIRLCRGSASDRWTPFPCPPSPEFLQGPSPGTSRPVLVQPPGFLLPLWPASQPLLGLLWGSAPGAASSLMEGRREISCSSSSGMGLYQISPSSSASFSSAGSMSRSCAETWLMLACVKTKAFAQEKMETSLLSPLKLEISPNIKEHNSTTCFKKQTKICANVPSVS